MLLCILLMSKQGSVHINYKNSILCQCCVFVSVINLRLQPWNKDNFVKLLCCLFSSDFPHRETFCWHSTPDCASCFLWTRCSDKKNKKRYSWQFWRKTVCCWVSFPGFQLLMLHFRLAATNPKHQNLTTWGRDTTISFLSPESLAPRKSLQVQTLSCITIVGHNWWLLGTIFVGVNKSYFPA